MAGRRTSSLARVSSWALALVLTVAYGAAGLALLMFRVELPLVLPWWALSAPPVVYAVVVAVAIPRFRFKRFLGGVLVVSVVNVLLAVLAAALIAAVEPAAFGSTLLLILGGLPALAILRLVWAPLVLSPFRDLLAVRPRVASRERATTPAPVPGPPLPPLPHRSPTPPVPSRSAEPERAAAPAPRAERPSAPAVPGKKPAPAAAPAPAPAKRGPVDPADLVRIPFERVANQLPAEAFALAVADAGARLREPGHLLVPRAMVVAQLLEGEVRVAWDVVADQFPAECFSVRTEQLGRRLATGLVLPLDEIVRQVPQEMFAFSGPTVDVRRLEDYPVPFQPHISPSAPETRQEPEPAPAPPASVPERAEVPVARESQPPSTVTDPRFEPEPEKTAPTAAAPEIEFDALTQVLVAAADPSAEPPAAEEPRVLELEMVDAGATREADRDESAALTMGEVAARGREVSLETAPTSGDAEAGWESDRIEVVPSPAPIPEARVVAPRPATPPAAEPSRERVQATPPPPRVAPRAVPNSERIAAALARHFVRLSNMLEIESRHEDGVALFVVAPPGAPRPALAGLAARVARVVGDERFPDEPVLVTISGDRGAAVVTPLGASFETAPLLVAMVARAGSLALLESLSRRAAVAVGTSGPADATTSAGGRHARGNGHHASLSGFGPVSASKQHPGGPLLHLALPAGMDANPVADLAVELYQAAEGAPAAGVGAFQSIAVQCASLSLVVREVESAPGRTAVLVAVGGPERRPGLARMQIERAAVQLGAGRA
jgi:hypothetical protein